MHRCMIVGLGLALGIAIALAGDDDQNPPKHGRAQEAAEVVSQPAPDPARAALPRALTRASPRPRLHRAIDVSRELAGKDEEPDTAELKQAAAGMGPIDAFPHGDKVKRFPRESHVAKHIEARPWSWYYAPWRVRLVSSIVPGHWPRWTDALALRALLQDKDPAMRAMAAEALATLHQPEDVARLGQLLDDDAAASPFLGHNMSRRARSLQKVCGDAASTSADPIVLTRSWRKETVAQAAQRALRLMTGMRFEDKTAFEIWWKVNSDGRNCLWYWQRRLERELNEADIATQPFRLYQRPDETWERYRARRQALRNAARAEVHRTIAAELRRLPPEVEANVRLLTVSDRTGDAPITGSEGQFWPDPPNLRISSDRLLDLLDRKDLWPDVPWDNRRPDMYNLLAERLGMWAQVFFRPADVPRLRAALKRERHNLSWSGQAAMIIGISRLLRPAPEAKLDDPNTRDGFLRQAVLGEGDPCVRDYCARELVRVGLPVNAAFLTDVSFVSSKDDQHNHIAQGILQALAQPPLTPQKRRFLIDLLLDRRFQPFWTRPNTPAGMDMCRQYGIWAVNTHAGRELIGNSIKNRLTDPAKSDKALAELTRLIAQLRQREAVPPETDPPPPRGRPKNQQ